MARMTLLQRVLMVAFYCLTASKGAFLSMLSQGQVEVLDAGQSIVLGCEFYTEYYSLFDNPVLWKKTQRHEETQVNIMGNIVAPFVDTKRFDVTFEQLSPRYRLKLKIVDVGPEDSGNYTCEVRGPKSSVLGVVTHTIFVRAPVQTIFISNTNTTEEDQGSRIRALSFVEHKPSTVRCISVGGYPPPEMDIYLGTGILTDSFALRETAELQGDKGLRLMIYRTERWTYHFRAEARHDEELLRCIVTVKGLGSKISHVKMHVQYAPIIKCDKAEALLGATNVYLRCEVEAKPGALKVNWSIGNGTSLSTGEVINEMWTLNAVRGDIIESKLFFRVATEGSFSTYKLVAENAIAETSKDVKLIQKYKDPPNPPSLEIIETGPHHSPSSHDRRSEDGYQHVQNSCSLVKKPVSTTFQLVVITLIYSVFPIVFKQVRLW